MKKLLLLFLFGTMAYAQPNINPPMDLFICETGGGNGIGFFDLTANNGVMLFGLEESLYNVKYYDTMSQAQFGGADNITNANNYASSNNTIYARVTEIANPENYTVASFGLMVAPVPAMVDLPAIMQCQSPFDLTANSNLIDNSYTVTYYTTMEDAEMDMNAIANPQSYVTETSSTVWVRITGNSPCYLIVEQELVIYSDALQVSVLFDGTQNVTITTAMEADYQYSMDEGPWQDSPAFTDLAYGMHIAKVQDPCGNVVVITFFVTPNKPGGEPEQTVNDGDTLADLDVEGENIQWYETETGDTPLNMNTVLVDNTTYYAAQSIDGVESAQRLGVTVHLTAGINDNIFSTLSYYPNPAESILNIENVNGIDTISVANTLGQTVFTKIINSNTAQVDVSSLSKGIYFVTAASGSAVKTLKIIKQ